MGKNFFCLKEINKTFIWTAMLVFFALSFYNKMEAQVTIWSEDFDSYSEGTTTGQGSPAIATWEADGVHLPGSGYNNNYGVDVRSGQIRGRYTTYGNPDYNTWQILSSDPIEITGYANVSIALDIQADYYFYSSDDIQIQYQIDNGSWTSFDINGEISSLNTVQSIQTGLSGDDLLIRVVIDNHYDWQYAYVDNIVVQGTLITSPPDCITPTSPADGETDVAVDEILCWNVEDQATGYKLYLGTDAAATNILNGIDVSDASYTYSSDFEYQTTYYWRVVPYNVLGDASACDTWNFTVEDPSYCDSYAWSYSDYYITNVLFNTIDNTSGRSDNPAYADYTSVSASVMEGQSYSLTVTVDKRWHAAYVKAWIDWNHDGDFDDTNEAVLSSSVVTGVYSGSVSETISVPSGAQGGKTRMRINVSSSSGVDACDYNSFNGEVEDYSLDVIVPTSAPSCVTLKYPTDGETNVPIDGTLSWSGDDIAAGYYLYLGTDANATNILNGVDVGSDTTYTLTPELNLLTTYYWKVVPYNSVGNATGCVVSSFTTQDVAFCSSYGNTNHEDEVTRVIFNDIDNASSGKTTGYTNYTAYGADVYRNSSYYIAVNVNTDGDYENYVRVWIDWNQDGDFDDAEEEYDLGSAENVTDGATDNSYMLIEVPASAALGTTRMRVSTKYNGYPSACETNFYGEVEDYSINVKELIAPVIGTVVQPTCSEITGSVELTGLPSGNWAIYQTPEDTVYYGSGTSMTISDMSAGIYTFSVREAGVCTGLLGEYYPNINLTSGTSDLKQVDANINFDWGTGSPDNYDRSDQFSIRWTGQVLALYDENYTFTTTSDDGVRLWVNGSLIIDEWNYQSATSYSGTIDLLAGQMYDIELEYFENRGDAVIRLAWASDSQASEVIPSSYLYVDDYEFNISDPSSVTINAPPVTVFDVQGGGTYCSANFPSISISGSETDVTYQLYKDGVAVGAAISGTGSELSFPYSVSEGTYTVIGTNATAGCSLAMNGSAIVVDGSPAAPEVNISGTLCPGNSVDLSISSVSDNTLYRWQYATGENGPWTYLTSRFESEDIYFESDFSSAPSDLDLYGTTLISSGGRLRFTANNVGNQTGAAVLDKTLGENLTAFNLNFDYRIWGGSGADGLSISYASDVTDGTIAVVGAHGAERGDGSGIRLCFDTYTNTTNRSQILLYYNSSVIWSNSVDEFYLRNSSYRNVNFFVDDKGYATLTIAGITIFANEFISGYAEADKSDWRFKFAGRTGGSTDSHRMDNIQILYGDTTTSEVLYDTPKYYRVVGIFDECYYASDAVYVADTVAPIVVCKSGLTAYLDSSGVAVLDVVDVDNGSTDDCGIDSMWLSPDTIDCSMLSTVSSGATASCSYIGSVVDNNGDVVTVTLTNLTINPTTTNCSSGYNYAYGFDYDISFSALSYSLSTKNIIVYKDGSPAGTGLLSGFSGIGEETSTMWRSESDCNTATFEDVGCDSIRAYIGDGGTNLPNTYIMLTRNNGMTGQDVSLIVRDESGNIDSCTTSVAVLDTIAPWFNVCPLSVEVCDTTYNPQNPVFDDNCQVDTLVWKMTGATSDSSAASGINYVETYNFKEGITTITYTATDKAGNSAICQFDVTVNMPMVSGISSNSPLCAGDDAEFTIYGNAGSEVTFSGDTAGTIIIGAGDSVNLTVKNAVADVILNLIQVSKGACDVSLSLSDTVIVYNSKAVAYDDFSNHAYGWDDGSTSSSWTGGANPGMFSIGATADSLLYEHTASGIFVNGGDDYLYTNTSTSGGSQSKYVSRTPKCLMNKTFYISFLARFAVAPSNSWNYIGLGKKDNTDDSGLALGYLGAGNHLGGVYGDNGAVLDVVTGSNAVAMQTYFVVGKWTVDASGITTIDFWLDPTALKTPTALYHRQVTLSSVDEMSSIDIQAFLSGTAYIDEIRYGFSWESVIPHHILVSSDEDNRIVAGESVTFTGYGGGDYEFFLNGTTVQPRSTTSTYTTTTLSDQDTVKVIVYHENGCDIDTAEIITNVVVNELSTDSVTMIMDTSAVLYGSVNEAYNVAEYGFYLSTSNEVNDLVSGTAMELRPTSITSGDVSGVSFSCSPDSLVNRKGYYFRTYMLDASGNYYYGDVVRFISEKRDFSLSLDGDGDAVVVDEQMTDSVINDWGSSDNTFSVEFWMKAGGSTTTRQILCADTSSTGGYLLVLDNNKIVLENESGDAVSSSRDILDNEWHYVVCVYDNGSACIQVDDSLTSSLSITITPPDTANCFIGAAYDGSSLTDEFEGFIDAMRFWNVALIPDQINELLYDNVEEGSTENSVQGVGPGKTIPSLGWANLKASFGFNVKSTEEIAQSMTSGFEYKTQEEHFGYPFMHNDARLSDSTFSFNVIVVGDAKPSPYLPRVNWRYNAIDSVWSTSENWSSNTYPGEGVVAGEYDDVSAITLSDDSVYCKYAIINPIDVSALTPVVTDVPPQVQVLVDRDQNVGSYSVADDGVSVLSILQKIIPGIFLDRILEDSSTILIEEGAVEVFE